MPAERDGGSGVTAKTARRALSALSAKEHRRVPVVDLDRVDGTGPGTGPYVFWLLLALWPAVRDLPAAGDGTRWVMVAVLAAFAGTYLATIRCVFDGRVPLWAPGVSLAVLAAITVAAALAFGEHWYLLFPLLGIAFGVLAGHFITRRAEPSFALGAGGVTVLSGLTAWAGGARPGTVFSIAYGTAMAATVTSVILKLAGVAAVLKRTREELAHAAVAEERLRFSRDLHDLLGHTLSLMVVKAQAVRRIAERDPGLAAEQAADIESVGRQALTEVREAVTGYRERGLPAELDAARAALRDAGVEVVVHRQGPPPPSEIDTLLGWAVREGVTNVIRHSGARSCEIAVSYGGGRAELTVLDDGPGTSATASGTTAAGHGLRGLAERLGAAGGTVHAGRVAGRGFRLRVVLPAVRSAEGDR